MVACLFYVVYNIHNKNVYSIEKTGGYTVREIRLKARAKINLTLDVTGKREDGYHLLETIMQTVALYDGIYMKKLEKPVIKLKTNLPWLPTDARNLAWKAANLMRETFGIKEGVFIEIDKRIPVAAGLAGGSTDCAAVLVGMNELYGAHLSMSELCALGAKIGADVPFALMGGTCRVQGVGDFLKALPPVPECWFTVVMPDYGVSTPEAFAAYDRVGSSIHPDCGAQEAAIRAGDLDALCAAAGNALEECSGAKDTGAIKALLREHGAVTALMTGSGAAVFGVFRDEGAARAAAQAAKRRWKQVYVAQPDRGGARVSR